MECVVALICLAVTMILYLILRQHRKLNYWKAKGIAYERGFPFFGSMLNVALLRKSEGELVNDIYKKFQGEKVVGIYGFHDEPALVVRDPGIIHKILVKDFHHFANNDTAGFDESLDSFVLNNILFQSDDVWKKNRALMASAFTASKVKLIYPQIVQIAEKFVDYLEKHQGGEIQVKEVMTRYTGEITGQLAFGINGKSFEESNPILNQMGKMLFRSGFKIGLKHLIMCFMPFLRKCLKIPYVPQEASDFFPSLLYDVISHRKQKKEEFHDLLQFLLDMKEKEKENILIDEANKKVLDINIMGTCITFFLEGYETSSGVLSHVLYNLAMNQKIQLKVRKEIDEALEHCNGEKLSFESISNLTYLNNVLLESNRIFPVVFGLDKVCTEKYEMDIGNPVPLIIEKGIPIHIPTFALHNDPLYWPDVHEFKPERFSNNGCTTAKSKGIFLPFGDGPRMCVGIRLSTTVLKVAMVHILRHFEVVPSPHTPLNLRLDPTYFLLSHKGGLYLKFVKRKH